MKINDCHLEGVKLIELKVNGDDRGFFIERFHEQRFKEAGLPYKFAQDNHSRSAPGVLRGLHYQYNPPQGKLVGVARGRVWDVAVDLRKGSKTFGKYFGAELSDSNGRLLWIPEGFAHGFCVLGEGPADMLYKVTGQYNQKGEGGVKYDDPDIGIQWPISNPILSDRDKAQPSLKDIIAKHSGGL